MHLICNELSFQPLLEDSHTAEIHFRQLLQCYKKATEQYNFTHIRFPNSYATLPLTKDATFIEWIQGLANPILKPLILDIFKEPYLDDLEQEDMEVFVLSDFKVKDGSCPTKDKPLGLAVASIKSVPAISLPNHEFWTRKIIQLEKISEHGEIVDLDSVNISNVDDLSSVEIQRWATISWSNTIADDKTLTKYLDYKKYKVTYSEGFMAQLFEWKKNDQEKYKYILALMKDAEIHPFTGGMGKTENLKKRGKEASKRITHGDRLSYTLTNNTLNFIACIGHYDFH